MFRSRFSITVKTISKRFTVLESVIQGLYLPLDIFCSLTPQMGLKWTFLPSSTHYVNGYFRDIGVPFKLHMQVKIHGHGRAGTSIAFDGRSAIRIIAFRTTPPIGGLFVQNSGQLMRAAWSKWTIRYHGWLSMLSMGLKNRLKLFKPTWQVCAWYAIWQEANVAVAARQSSLLNWMQTG